MRYCYQSLNWLRVQVEGGVVQAIGMALYEDVRYSNNGRLETNNLMTYKIPTRQDIGELHVDLVESYEPTGGFGANLLVKLLLIRLVQLFNMLLKTQLVRTFVHYL